MKTSLCVGLLVLLVSAVAARGTGVGEPNDWWISHIAYRESPLFTPHELDLDLFGSYVGPKRNLEGGYWGGGVGLSHFYTRSLGLGADVSFSDRPGGTVDQFTGNVIFRLPLGESGLAPYVFGGGGRSVNPQWDWVYGAGAGLEYRFTKIVGVFGDGRFLWADRDTNGRLLVRAGVRIIF